MLGALLARALEPVDLRVIASRAASGSCRGFEATPVVVDGVVVAGLPELLADRGELLAQQELALRLVHVVADASADLIRQLELGQRLARPAERLLEARLGVERLEQLDLALDRQVGRPAGGVGERAGVVDALQRVGEARRAELLGDPAHDGPVLPRQLTGPAGLGRRLGDGLDAEPDAGVTRSARARRRARGQAAQHQGAPSAGQVALVLDPGDGADRA